MSKEVSINQNHEWLPAKLGANFSSNKLKFISYAAVFGLLGAVILFSTRAATPNAQAEAELGSVSGSASVVSNQSGSSNNAHIKFGSGNTVEEPKFVAVGDIACDPARNLDKPNEGHCKQLATSALAINQNPNLAFVLGDAVYNDGSANQFRDWYTPSWGRSALLNVTYPSIGNHEYHWCDKAIETTCIFDLSGKNDKTDPAEPYWEYYKSRIPSSALGTHADPASRKGYYSIDIGNWHIVVLNTNCPVNEPVSEKYRYQTVPGGCATHLPLTDSQNPQYDWLRTDLNNSTKPCTLAIYPNPYRSSYPNTSGWSTNSKIKPIWDLLASKNVDVVLNGDTHNYQRFAPTKTFYDFDANINPGTTQFIVGTGGKGLSKLGPDLNTKYLQNISPSKSDEAFGILTGTLKRDRFSFNFLPVRTGTAEWEVLDSTIGSDFTDSGEIICQPK